jgi:hypothetical protein
LGVGGRSDVGTCRAHVSGDLCALYLGDEVMGLITGSGYLDFGIFTLDFRTFRLVSKFWRTCRTSVLAGSHWHRGFFFIARSDVSLAMGEAVGVRFGDCPDRVGRPSDLHRGGVSRRTFGNGISTAYR